MGHHRWLHTMYIAIVLLGFLLSQGAGREASAGPNIVYVDVDAPGEIGTGDSWADAYVSLQFALALEPGPAEFWVAAGTYKAAAFFADPRFGSIGIGAGQEVYGGFAGTETARDQRNTSLNPVTLSGEIGTATAE